MKEILRWNDGTSSSDSMPPFDKGSDYSALSTFTRSAADSVSPCIMSKSPLS